MSQLTFQDVSQHYPDGTVNRITGVRLATGEMLDGLFEFGTMFRRMVDGSIREVLYLELADFGKDVRSERVVIQQIPAPVPAVCPGPATEQPQVTEPPAAEPSSSIAQA
jgi:hypothetical protein